MTSALEVKRAAGAALKTSKRRGDEPLKPSLAIEALVSAMRERFSLEDAAARELFSPALADFRDAVGSADPLLLPENAKAEAQLVPLPMPSWCAWLFDLGVLTARGPPALEGPRIVLRADLHVVREREESFPVVFAGRASRTTAAVSVHLAVSPPWASKGFRGPIQIRAAAHRGGSPVPLWVGAPAAPGAETPGRAGTTVATWTTQGILPRWLVVRAVEGREPQALWDLHALWAARLRGSPEVERAESPAQAEGKLRLAIDLGSTATVVVEEDAAFAGSVGRKLESAGSTPSGFLRLAGDERTAGAFGCGEELQPGQLPTALCAGSAQALSEVLADPSAADQLWLPQEAAAPAPLRIDRFKSPELLLLSDWPPEVAAPDLTATSKRLLETYGALLGRTLAVAHATPFVAPEPGRFQRRWPRLASIEVVLTYPQCAFDPATGEPFSRALEGVGRALCGGLEAAWPRTQLALVPDPAAAKAAREPPVDERHPIEVMVDFGGLTLQITVRLPLAEGRPAPLVQSTSTSYLLGGERLIDAAAFASADAASTKALREEYRSAARRLRGIIANGSQLSKGAAAVGETVLDTALALVRRQVEGTLRRAQPSAGGAGVRLYLLGESWKLIALDVPDHDREREMLRRLSARLLEEPLVKGMPVRLERMSKRRLCEGALRVQPGPLAEDEPVELFGIDAAEAGTVRRRFFGIAGKDDLPGLAPSSADPWWQAFSGGAESLLRVEQWFHGHGSPFRGRLAAGRLAFDPKRPLLKQWLDVSGPSLVALRIRDALTEPLG